MSSTAKWFLVLAVVMAAGAFFIHQQYSDARAHAYRHAVSELKRDFAKGAVGLRLLDPERERKKMAADLAAGKLKEAQKQAMEERLELTLDLFKRMRTGQYRPLYTGADKTFRFDIYELGRGKVNGQDRVKLSFVHWGAFGNVTYSMIEGQIRAQQEKGQPVALHKIVAEGAGPNLMFDGERWLAEHIPGVTIGYYDLPLLPREATALQLSFEFHIQSPGGTALPVSIAFPDMPVPDEWKVAPGQKWQGEELIASEEELKAAGVAPTP